MSFQSVQSHDAKTLRFASITAKEMAVARSLFNSRKNLHKIRANGIVRMARSYSCTLGLSKMTPDNNTGIHRFRENRPLKNLRDKYARKQNSGMAYSR